MINLGTVRPGRTIRIPFASFAASTGASSAMSGTATSDIVIYKDGSTTARASTSGYTFSVDFDTKTGLNVVTIDLADNTTAGFYTAGSEYLVGIADVTVDSQTVRTWIARFEIGYPDAVINTTIATLSSQTSFTLTSGPAEDDALNGCVVCIHDLASAVQLGFAVVLDYTGSTKTVTLTAGVSFTAAAGDNVSIFSPGSARWVGSNLQTGAFDFAEMASFISTLAEVEITQPGQTNPPAGVTLREAVGYLYKAWRNKSDQTASTYRLYADDGTTVDQKRTVSDDGTTTTIGEVVSGP